MKFMFPTINQLFTLHLPHYLKALFGTSTVNGLSMFVNGLCRLHKMNFRTNVTWVQTAWLLGWFVNNNRKGLPHYPGIAESTTHYTFTKHQTNRQLHSITIFSTCSGFYVLTTQKERSSHPYWTPNGHKHVVSSPKPWFLGGGWNYRDYIIYIYSITCLLNQLHVRLSH